MQSAILEKITYPSHPPYPPENGNAAVEKIQSQYFEFAKKRSAPDVVVVDHQGQILFVSHHDFSVLSLLEANEENPEKYEAKLRLRQILKHLSITVFSQKKTTSGKTGINTQNALFSFGEQDVSLRGQRLKGASGTPDFVMILIEPIKHSIRSATQPRCVRDFTPREQSVLHYVKKGFTNKEIACVLNIGVHTIKDHVKRIMKKVNVHTRTGIAGKLEETLGRPGQR